MTRALLLAAGIAAGLAGACASAPRAPADWSGDPALCPSRFEDFAAAFSRSAPVQRAYTRFPLRVRRLEQAEPEPRPVERTVRRDELPFPYLPLEEARSSEGRAVEVLRGRGGVRKLKLYEPDTDHQQIYSFEQRAGCWWLVEIDDQSIGAR